MPLDALQKLVEENPDRPYSAAVRGALEKELSVARSIPTPSFGEGLLRTMALPRRMIGRTIDTGRALAEGVVDSTISAATLAGDVYSGKVPVFGPDGHVNPEVIRRAVDVVGLAPAGAAFVPKNTLGMAGGKLAAKGAALPMDEASRLARAGEIGFRTDMPLAFGTAPAGEKVGSAAIKVNGRVFTGRDHGEAVLNAERELGIPFEEMQPDPILDGFVTNAGRYVSRREAADIAQREGQGEAQGIFGATRGLASEGTKMETAPSQSPVRTGATAPGLPGGNGSWGVLLPAGSPASDAIWHRASRPMKMDAQGLADHEIQANLVHAWDNGFDAVMLKNYTRPGGEKPETIIVVRDLAQLRSPNAAFDPAKKHSPDLLAANDPKAMAAITAAREGIRAHHVSPSSFERFDDQFIGRGFGGRAEGRGHYVTSSKDLMETYAGLIEKQGGKPVRYDVDVRADPNRMLDWNKRLSEQPDVAEALRKVGEDIVAAGGDARQIRFGLNKASPGHAAYRALSAAVDKLPPDVAGVDPEAYLADLLQKHGIPGNRYVKAGDTKPSYVVFSDSLIDIVNKYGIAGAAAALGLSQADVAKAAGMTSNGEQPTAEKRLNQPFSPPVAAILQRHGVSIPGF